jgi:hypothetical protein
VKGGGCLDQQCRCENQKVKGFMIGKLYILIERIDDL